MSLALHRPCRYMAGIRTMCEYLSDFKTAVTYTYSEINIHNRTEHVHIQLGFRVLFSVFFDRFQIKKISQKCHVMMFIENPNAYPHNYCKTFVLYTAKTMLQ